MTFFKKNDLCSVHNDIITACVIFLTLSVTVIYAKHSFSKLKLIKNYLRNCTSQVCLSHIVVKTLKKTRKLNIEKIINNYSDNKGRKFFF